LGVTDKSTVESISGATAPTFGVSLETELPFSFDETP